MIAYLGRTSPDRLKGTCLLRLDLNTADEWRLRASLSTIRFILRHAGKVVVLSHLGRPGGRRNKLTLRGKRKDIQRFLGERVAFIGHFRFPEMNERIRKGRERIFLLENLRFLPGEDKNDPKLARRLAKLGDYYVNDAFAVSHRRAASLAAITGFLPSYAGLELEREMKALSDLLRKPSLPLVVVLGGAKAHDKLGVLRFLRDKADAFLLGGAAANTLLYLKGTDVGRSLTDEVDSDFAGLRRVLKYPNLLLPSDWKKEKNAILDIGPRTVRAYAEKIRSARTVIWSGPLGFVEKKEFSKGTLAIAKAIAGNKKAFRAVGGGETVMFLKKHELDKKFSFISTGGGAFLEFLAGEKLPGIEALRKKR